MESDVRQRAIPGLAVVVLLCLGLLIAVTPELLITGNLIRVEKPRVSRCAGAAKATRCWR